MRLDRLTVNLRERSSWEAMELGMALVRRHAAAIWKPWLWFTLPVFVLLNLLAWAIDAMWLAGLLLWWLKPVFDRIPLFVVSRGVFGDVPTLRQTLGAARDWGWRAMLPHLTWRRLSLARSLFLPVDLLEGGHGAQRRARRRALSGGAYGSAMLLTTLCLHFEAMLLFAAVAAIFMFVPFDALSESARAALSLVAHEPPLWVGMASNALGWIAMSVIEPFYVGAGFGLYLNRRTQLEAWDVEIAFRRLRQRLEAGASLMLVLLVLFCAPLRPAQAETSDTAAVSGQCAVDVDTPAEKQKAATLAGIFGEARRDDAGFRKAADEAYRDPLLGGRSTTSQWKPRHEENKKEESSEHSTRRRSIARLGGVIAFIGEWGAWLLVGVIVLALLLLMPRWLPWMRGKAKKRERAVDAPQVDALDLPEALPDDLPGTARRWWREGRPRQALALLYRAGVERMAERAGAVLPPGATEAQCLRASQRLADPQDRELFARLVRMWQYAAYAHRLPEENEFEAMLDQFGGRYGWTA